MWELRTLKFLNEQALEDHEASIQAAVRERVDRIVKQLEEIRQAGKEPTHAGLKVEQEQWNRSEIHSKELSNIFDSMARDDI